VALTLAGVVACDTVEQLLLIQSPVMVGTSLLGACVLLRLAPERRNMGTRITATALLGQAGLWTLYFFVYRDTAQGAWPLVRTTSAVIAAHNSYFDLALDVVLASGLVLLLLQDVHRRQMEAEAERSRLRAELDRTQRLGSLRTLVSGVAHELNNPLTAIPRLAEARGRAGQPGERAPRGHHPRAGPALPAHRARSRRSRAKATSRRTSTCARCSSASCAASSSSSRASA
jgi:signal transduction histidine kinase